MKKKLGFHCKMNLVHCFFLQDIQCGSILVVFVGVFKS